ncbi:hypothetical protein GBAR_LOCUS10805 [Geodia barretti]|uniref:Uncharacterized protein n=1 Tax=Geodia barretti TaxID=519541 RepID=A0AA35WL69_GEOBA|nr:hypothetical protein GBAR_LOCUS10805 [Geodia barretti]
MLHKVPLYVIFVGGVKGVRYVMPEVLVNPILSDSFGFSDEKISLFFLLIILCNPIGTALLYTLQYFKVKGYGLTVVGLICTITSLLIMTDWQAIGSDPCTEHSLFHHPQLADQYRLELAESNISESGMVSVQSLLVVEGEVYQMAVNRCESAEEHCHWIPNSLVTGKHCSDCQPICRSPRHTLNFVQFTVGFSFFVSTLSLMYVGIFILVSNSVSKQFQGISVGVTTALMGAARGVVPLIMDVVYEHVQKRTYLVMLIQVGVFLPLLIGLFLLYPWLAGSRKIDYSQDNQEQAEEEADKTT